MKIDTSLLDLDRVPTMDELKAFFRKHDWSAAQLSDRSSRSAEKHSAMKHIKKLMDAEFEKISREKGWGAPSKYFENIIEVNSGQGNIAAHQGNSLLELRDNAEDLVSDAVYEIAENHEDILDSIMSKFDFSDPDIDKKADELLHNAVDTMLDIMDYEEIAKIMRETSDIEDFNPNIYPNYRAEDHERRWYHLDTKHPTLPYPDFNDTMNGSIPDVEKTVISNITAEEFWKTLDDKDKIILKLLLEGYTQKEAAEAVGMANNSGVSKRISKLRKRFTEYTGIKIG